MKVALGSDHAGFVLRQTVVEWLAQKGVQILDYGVQVSEREQAPRSVDYPDFAAPVVNSVLSKQSDWGVLICGSGLGMSYAANRYEGIRAALCREEHSARMARQHNDANILVLGERFTGRDLALAIVNTWMESEFEGGRHARRIALLDQMPDWR
ncbi:MAG: ribose 5-phosphate isomerase B [Myxococcota bacterium]